jgi:uncharacterized integral membrane protein
MKVQTVVILVLAALLIIILIQNVEVVTLKFLFWEISMSRILFIPIIMVIGFILGFFAGKTRKK